MPTTVQPQPNQKAFELKIEPGSEGVFRLIAVPPITLDLKLASFQGSGRTYKIKMVGTHQNLPEGTTCRVIVKANAFGKPRPSDVSSVPMQLEGNRCSIELEVDAIESGFFGTGTVDLSVIPDFPFATEWPVGGAVARFDNPLEFSPLNPTDGKSLEVLLGQEIELKPKVSSRFKDTVLKLSVFKTGQSDSTYTVFEWDADDHDDSKSWRAGCAESDGRFLLTYLDVNQKLYTYTLRLEIIDEKDGKKEKYLVWEKAKAISFPKPELEGFDISQMGNVVGDVVAKVKNLAPGFSLPLELSLWVHQPLAPDAPVHVMNPVTRPTEAEASKSNWFLELFNSDLTLRDESQKLFALLRIPKTLTGSETYVPVSAVLDYDEKNFFPFDDDELWLEPPTPGKGKKVSKTQKSPKELATAIASMELKLRPSRTPHFGEVTAGVQGNQLRLAFKLVGDIQYWKDAAPSFSIYDELGEKELVKLKVKPSANNPRIHEALVPLADKQLLGQKVSIRGKLTKPEAKLWGDTVAPPEMAPFPYECVPKLSDVRMNVVKLTEETSYIQAKCRAQHIPNGKGDGTAIAFRAYEIMTGLDEPILLTAVRFWYDIPKNKSKGGLSDPQGQFSARIKSTDAVQRLLGKGKFRLDAYVLDNKGKALNVEVEKASLFIGDEPRNVAGTLLFGKLVSPEFRMKVKAICADLEISADDLMVCMAHETDYTFSASKRAYNNKNAVGLIQFTPVAVKDLNRNEEDPERKKKPLTLDELAGMSELTQLDWVQKYFRLRINAFGPLKTLEDLYASILCPSAVHQPDTFKCFFAGSAEYARNASLDKGPDGQPKGYISKADMSAPVLMKRIKGKEERE
ncbi:hypothetical protein F0U60_23265 [Archangium minus]|uniref:Transglycosylase SLT domain-containing protein n=1 Tax=Archangium minus TaxID=83450 RepID=A0ABY9WU23_9BACT|nr:hypothetical protein F0U60_23265 [Archangium minus]